MKPEGWTVTQREYFSIKIIDITLPFGYNNEIVKVSLFVEIGRIINRILVMDTKIFINIISLYEMVILKKLVTGKIIAKKGSNTHGSKEEITYLCGT